MKKSEIGLSLSNYYFEREGAAGFDVWLYDNPSVQDEIGEADYVNLVSQDFRGKEGQAEIRCVVKDVYERHYGCPIFVPAILNAIEGIVQETDLVAACDFLSKLHMEGVSIVPIDFVGYSSEIERLGSAELYKGRIQDAARALRLVVADLMAGVEE
ncbi:MAG: hypothetical protein J0L85_14855 [Zoogloea sp.]|nr:hypothetical protein [Zoogloea sp.]